jgi:hypothetical protein
MITQTLNIAAQHFNLLLAQDSDDLEGALLLLNLGKELCRRLTPAERRSLPLETQAFLQMAGAEGAAPTVRRTA